MQAMNTQIDFMKTQPMPTRDRLMRAAQGVQTWADGKVADFNARKSVPGVYRVKGWTVIES